MNFLKGAVEYFNYAVGFTNEFNGTGLLAGMQEKRPVKLVRRDGTERVQRGIGELMMGVWQEVG